MLAGAGVGGGTTSQLDDVHRRARSRSATEWASDARPRGRDRAGLGRRRRGHRARPRRRRGRPHIPPKDAIILRGARGARLGGGPDPPERRRLRRLRVVPVRLSARAPSSPACGSTSPRGRGGRPDRARCPRRPRAPRGRPAVGVEAVGGRVTRPRDGQPRRLRGPSSGHGRGRGRRAAEPGRPAALRARRIPAIGRYLRLHPVPVVAGRFAEPIEMWRGTMQAARSASSSSSAPRTAAAGTATSSSPRRVIPGCSRSRSRGRATDAHARLMADAAHLSPLIAVTRDGGEGRVTPHARGSRPDRLPARRHRASPRFGTRSSAWHGSLRAAGATEIVAVGTPPLWHRRGGATGDEDAARSAGYDAALAVVRLRGRIAGRSSRPTRWGPSGWAPIRATHPCDPWGRVRVDGRAATPSSAACTSGTGRPSRPGIGRQSDAHDHGARATDRADDPRRDAEAALSCPRRRSDGRRGAGGDRWRLGRRRGFGAVHPAARRHDERDRGDDDPRPRRSVRGSIGSWRTIAPSATATTGLT